MATRKNPRRKMPEPSLRHAWLAGLGLIAVTRRQAAAAAAGVADRLHGARLHAEKLAGDAQRDVLERFAAARRQGEAGIDRLGTGVETRLQPMLARLGLKPAGKPAARTRKPATRRTASRTRTAPARKPAAKRARTRSA